MRGQPMPAAFIARFSASAFLPCVLKVNRAIVRAGSALAVQVPECAPAKTYSATIFQSLSK